MSVSLPLLSPSCLPFKGVSQTAYFHTTRSNGLARAHLLSLCLWLRNGSYVACLWAYLCFGLSRILAFLCSYSKHFNSSGKGCSTFLKNCVCADFFTRTAFLFSLSLWKNKNRLYSTKKQNVRQEKEKQTTNTNMLAATSTELVDAPAPATEKQQQLKHINNDAEATRYIAHTASFCTTKTSKRLTRQTTNTHNTHTHFFTQLLRTAGSNISRTPRRTGKQQQCTRGTYDRGIPR